MYILSYNWDYNDIYIIVVWVKRLLRYELVQLNPLQFQLFMYIHQLRIR